MTVTTPCLRDVAVVVAEDLANQLGQRKYAMWFERSAQMHFDERAQRLSITVPNKFTADWIRRHFTGQIHKALQKTTDLPFTDQDEAEPAQAFDIIIDQQSFDQEEVTRSAANLARPAAPDVPTMRVSATSPTMIASKLPSIPGLRPLRLRHELADFVVGPSNELAFAAAQAIAGEDDPGHPMFLHGGCGLGKTHLLQGLCAAFAQIRPDARILYTTGEQFTNAYVTAVRNNKLEAFRSSVRSLDLLAVDDIHFIANKDKTQQEFLHCFEQIELTGSRLALASDQHPKAIEQFSEGLVSRCVRGLVVSVSTPDQVTRRNLVQALAKRRRLLLTDSVIDTFANDWHGSIRELEGMLTKLQALATLRASHLTAPIGRDLVEQLFASESAGKPRTVTRFTDVLQAAIKHTGIPRDALLGQGRQKQVVLVRSMIIHLTRELTTLSYPEIAHAMGKKNHSTIITADKRMQRQLDDDVPVTLPGLDTPVTPRELYDQLKRKLA